MLGENQLGEGTGLALSSLVIVYVGVSLTIPLWVPIVKRLTGDCGIFWVSGPATYC